MMPIADWVVASSTLLLALVAIFQDRIQGWLLRPKLDVSIRVAPPDCHKTILRRRNSEEEPVECYYLRLRIANEGNHRAEMVEVFAAEVAKKQADGTFQRVDSFLPMNLVWSHTGEVFMSSISPGMYRYCDMAHINHPEKRSRLEAEDATWPNIPAHNTILSFDTIVRPYTLSTTHPHGTYQVVLLVAAANAKPGRSVVEINLTGDWYDEESMMLSQGVGIRTLK